MLTTRMKTTDFWIYPSPIRPGDWRVTLLRSKPIQRLNTRFQNKFAWKVRVLAFDYSEPYFEYFSEEYFDDEPNGGSLEYWAGDVPMLCDFCPAHRSCIELGCDRGN